MLAGCGVDALCVLGGNLVEDLDLASDQPIAFSMRVTDGTAGAFGCNRCSYIPLGLGDHRLQVLVEPGIGGFDVRGVFDERRRHVRHL